LTWRRHRSSALQWFAQRWIAVLLCSSPLSSRASTVLWRSQRQPAWQDPSTLPPCTVARPMPQQRDVATHPSALRCIQALREEPRQLLRHSLRIAAPVSGAAVARPTMIKARQLDAPRLRQYLCEPVQGALQIGRAFAPAEQQCLHTQRAVTLRLLSHFGDELEVVVQGRRKRPHGHIAGPSHLLFSPHPLPREGFQQPARQSTEEGRPHLRAEHASDKRGSDVSLGDLAIVARQE